MVDWDVNSPALTRNLEELGRAVADAAAARRPLSSETIRTWHALLCAG